MGLDWKLKEKLAARLAREQGHIVYPAGGRARFALAYPNSYFVGMSNLGLHIIYDILNHRTDTACERFFFARRARAGRIPTHEDAAPQHGNAVAAFGF